MAIKKKLNYEKVEEFNLNTTDELAVHYKEILRLIGENPDREGLEKTPLRVAKAIQFLTQGYSMDPKEILSSAKFREDYREMVIVKDIEIYSLCEHHMVPFIGKAHVAYIPDKYITGLSKIARVVDIYARRLQVQLFFRVAPDELPGFRRDGADGGQARAECSAPRRFQRGGLAARHGEQQLEILAIAERVEQRRAVFPKFGNVCGIFSKAWKR